jgi:nucleotide-binding universal stress UspA family protein
MEQAIGLAREAGVSATTEMQTARYAVDVLLPESENHDLLVLGSHGNSRASGFVFGSTASEAVHGTERPLLIAREPPDSVVFPRTILFASDGSPGSWAPAKLAAKIAAAFNSELGMIHVVDGTQPERKRVIEEQIAEVAELAGREPELTEVAGHPTQEIVDSAHSKGSSLIISGRRGLRGIKALGSVSERVVHRA